MKQELQVKNRIGWIDIAKAIGIVIVLLNHAELSLGFVTFLGGMFYMPVFFVLSGYTYKDKREETVKTFLLSKAKRLLVPYGCFQFVLVALFTIKNIFGKQTILQILTPIIGAIYSRNALYANAKDTLITVPSSNINLMTVYNAPLWFLTCLFITLIIYKVIMTLAGGSAKKELLFLGMSIFLGIIFKYFCPILLPWSIDTALISVGYIYFGQLLKNKDIIHKSYKKPFYILILSLGFVILSYFNGSGNMSIRDFGKSVLLSLVVGGIGSLLVILFAKMMEENVRFLNFVLEIIGRHTIGILAFHLVIFAFVVVATGMIGISGGIIEKIAKIVVSVVILVPTDWFIQKYLPFIYGTKRRNK